MEFEDINLLTHPPSVDEILHIGQLIGGLRNLLHPGKKDEEAYRQHIEGRSLSDRELAEVLHRYPDLMLKPVLYNGRQALVGFSEEQYRQVFAQV